MVTFLAIIGGVAALAAIAVLALIIFVASPQRRG